MSIQRTQRSNGLGLTYLLLLASLLLPMYAEAAAYTYTLIADTSDTFIALDRASINDRGTVAFFGNRGLPDGNSTSVFVGDGRTTTVVALALDPNVGSINNGSGPSINNAGQVIFLTSKSAGEQSILLANRKSLIPIVETAGTSFTAFGLDPVVNNPGPVGCSAGLEMGVSGIFTSDGGPPVTRADSTGAFSGFSGRVSINNRSLVVFSAGFDGGGSGLITSDRHGNLFTIVTTGGSLDGFIHPVINEAGVVAFEANPVGFPLLDGGIAIFTSDGILFTKIADNSGAYNTFGVPPGINNRGDLAFFAALDAGGMGIFTGADSLTDKVIATGDPLFGSTVSFVGFLRGALNNRGQVAFSASLTDGRRVIVRANPAGGQHE